MLIVSFQTQVYESTTQAQKEKNEEDLKKQIKKLQRYRDSLKGWSTSTDSTITVDGLTCFGDE